MTESLLLLLSIGATECALAISLAGILFWYAGVLKQSYLHKWGWSVIAVAVSVAASVLGFWLSSNGAPSSAPLRIAATLLMQVAIYLHLALLSFGTVELLLERKLPVIPLSAVAIGFGAIAAMLFAFEPEAVVPRLVLRIGLHYFIGAVVVLALAAALHRILRSDAKVLRNAFLIYGLFQLMSVAMFVAQLITQRDLGGRLFIAFDLIGLTILGAGMVIWLIESERARGTRANADIERLTQYDTETGLANQSSMLRLSHELLKRGQTVGLMVVDLDHFRSIGDSLAREQVTEVFHEFARRVRSCLRSNVTLARLKHDTFAVILPDSTPEELEQLARQVQLALAPEIKVTERGLFLSGSIGMAIAPMDAQSADALLRAALLAVNQCKSLGRGQSRFYAPELNEQADLRLGLIADLRHALNEEQFVLHYQPIYALRSAGDSSLQRKLTGFEALLRWQHPVRGLLQPAEFVHSLEAAGIAEAVDQMVLRHSIKQIKAWRLEAKHDLSVAINICAASFQAHDFPKFVAGLLNEFAVSASAIELEITESMALQNLEVGLSLLTQMRALGVNVSLDDFGTGYSSLSHLRLLPVSKIKIDRSFIRDILSDRKDAAIVSALIELAHSLDLAVVAEGVENAEQLAFLQAHNADFVQGFLLSKPLVADTASALVFAQDLPESARSKVTPIHAVR